jgi:hypothetical protein
MIGIRVSITRYISDDPQPGIVECEFTDAHGHQWKFVEKTGIVSADDMDAETPYPQPGTIACKVVVRKRDVTGKEIIVVDTEQPWDIESVDGNLRFEVLPTSLVEWDWGSKDERPRNGQD